MKTDTYIKTVLTVIAVLLLVLAVRPVMPSSVHAAEAIPYEYTWVLGKWLLDDETHSGFGQDMETLNKLAKQGAEVIGVVPIAGNRSDNIASGTANILYVLRSPKSVSASQKKN